MSRDGFGAKHETSSRYLFMLQHCCSGDSDPICIPVWRAAGWFGVDPPHLRWDPTRRGCPRVARGACRTTGESGGRGARRTRRRPRFRSAAHRSKWHPGGTCLHLLGAAAARPQLALRRPTPGCGERWACCTPWRWAVWGDRQGQGWSGPIRVRAGHWARPDRGGGRERGVLAVRVRAGARGPA